MISRLCSGAMQAEVNLFNRHYYQNPITDITNKDKEAFGYVTDVQGTSRQGQFGARLQW